jgi:NADH-quinone oxidoreductase subunit L
LAFLSFVGGWMKTSFGEFLAPLFASSAAESLEPHKSAEHIMAIISVVWAANWAFIAWVIYSQRPTWPAIAADKFRGVYKLLTNKYYIDELYVLIFVRPLRWLFEQAVWHGFDESIIDNVGVNGSSRTVGLMGGVTRLLQTGLAPHYMFFMVLGLVFVIVWVVL